MAHPILLRVMGEYMGIDALHFGTLPWPSVHLPNTGGNPTQPSGGWHSDYPYRDGRFRGDAFPTDMVLGVQCNICIDEFRANNAATMFCLGSHKVRSPAPSATAAAPAPA
jgi:hypothetical protein